MSTSVMTDKTIRIALLLREADVLDDAHWQEFAKRAGLKAEKGAWEILSQDVSLSAFRDLLFMDLRVLVPGRTRSELEQALGMPVRIYANELAAILRVSQPDVAHLCHLLISRGLISTKDLEDVLDRAEQNALNVYDLLVAQRLITAENIEKVVQDRKADFARENRILLAGDILIFNNLITKDDFSQAMETCSLSHVPLSRALEDLKLLTQDELFSMLEKGLELPTVEMSTYDISSELIQYFPQEFMRRQLFLPVSAQTRLFEIATADPFNLALADTITILTGRRVTMIYCSHSDLLAKFEQVFGTGPGEPMPLTSMPEAVAKRAVRVPAPGEAEPPASAAAEGKPQPDAAVRVPEVDVSRRRFEPFIDNLSTVQLVTQLIESAVGAGATDIHIEPQLDAVRIRYRVDGVLHTIMKVPVEMHLSVISRIKVLASMNVTERRRPQDGHFSLTTHTGGYDFRVSSLPSFYGEKIVMRVLDSSRVLTGLPQLGLETEQLKTIERMIERPYGLILVTGPTGSGKTSTLYACLSTVNREGVNIITIEDPVEYQLDGITQVQVDDNIDLTFASGLRSSLRQDPDIIMVGEIRDPDTAYTAIRAALTGHLVLSTLHTNTAIGAVSALTHMGAKHYLISSGLLGIIAQRLVRRICPACKKTFAPPKEILRELGFQESTRRKFHKGEGCEQCFSTGYVGRTGVFEIIEATEELRRAIVSQTGEHELAEIAHKRAQTLPQSAVNKVIAGVTTPAEALKAVTM